MVPRDNTAGDQRTGAYTWDRVPGRERAESDDEPGAGTRGSDLDRWEGRRATGSEPERWEGRSRSRSRRAGELPRRSSEVEAGPNLTSIQIYLSGVLAHIARKMSRRVFNGPGREHANGRAGVRG